MGELGDRMKAYEGVSQTSLTMRMPAIIRIDGKAFHSFTRGMAKPWDPRMERAMQETMVSLCTAIEGAALGYWQSDEISLLLINYKRLTTNPWFGGNVQKIVSVSAALATYHFASAVRFLMPERAGAVSVFDSRVFTVPREDVTNYFLWRQQDAVRNSISGLAQAHFSHTQLHGKGSEEMQDMLWKMHGVNWNNTPTHQKRGACAVRDTIGWTVDPEVPMFSQDRDYIERLVNPADEEGASLPIVAP